MLLAVWTSTSERYEEAEPTPSFRDTRARRTRTRVLDNSFHPVIFFKACLSCVACSWWRGAFHWDHDPRSSLIKIVLSSTTQTLPSWTAQACMCGSLPAMKLQNIPAARPVYESKDVAPRMRLSPRASAQCCANVRKCTCGAAVHRAPGESLMMFYAVRPFVDQKKRMTVIMGRSVPLFKQIHFRRYEFVHPAASAPRASSRDNAQQIRR